MWHIFPPQLVRHVVMCLLIAGLKDKPLISSLMLWMISRLPFFSSERENRRVRRERKACFLFFSSTLFHVTSWFMRAGSSLIEMSVCAARIMEYVFLPNSNSSTSSTAWSNFQLQLFPTRAAHFSNPHADAREIWNIFAEIYVEEEIIWSNF